MRARWGNMQVVVLQIPTLTLFLSNTSIFFVVFWGEGCKKKAIIQNMQYTAIREKKECVTELPGLQIRQEIDKF